MKPLLHTVSAALLVLLGSAPQAFASPQMLDVSSGSTTFNNLRVVESDAELFGFTLDSISNVQVLINADAGFRHANVDSILLTGPSGTYTLLDRASSTGAPSWALNARSLAAGSYTVSVRGLGGTPEHFSGNLGVDPTPIPEPATLALAALGLAGVALQREARRRR